MCRAALWMAVTLVLAGCAAVPARQALRDRAVTVLREGLASSEFWPSMHAAEGLTRAGLGNEVSAALTPRLPDETDDQHRCGLARELVRAGAETQEAVMVAILNDPASKGRVHACESLFKVNRVGDREALVRALREDDPRLVAMAAAALARQGDAGALARLRAGLADPDPGNRELVAWVLGQVGDRQDWTAIRKLAAAEAAPLARSTYWNALARLGAPKALAIVTANLSAAEPEIRTSAAEALGPCGGPGQVRALEALLTDPVLDARTRAADALLWVLSREAR